MWKLGVATDYSVLSMLCFHMVLQKEMTKHLWTGIHRSTSSVDGELFPEKIYPAEINIDPWRNVNSFLVVIAQTNCDKYGPIVEVSHQGFSCLEH